MDRKFSTVRGVKFVDTPSRESGAQYNHAIVELLDKSELPFDEETPDLDIIPFFNKQLRKTRYIPKKIIKNPCFRIDTLVCIYNSQGRSYSKKNCVFIHGEMEKEAPDKVIWEIAHELCHSVSFPIQNKRNEGFPVRSSSFFRRNNEQAI